MLRRSLHGAFPPKSISWFHELSFKRHVSFTTAINKGVRKANNRSGRLGSFARASRTEQDGKPKVTRGQLSRLRLGDETETKSTSWQTSRRSNRRHDIKEEVLHEAPLGKPFTTAGSEFLYGSFAVKAALQAGRRKLHKLYIWQGQDGGDSEYDHSIRQLARSKRLPTQLVAGSWDKMLLKMSNQRPHNGVVLEASPVPKLPVLAMKPLTNANSELQVQVAAQSLEDKKVNEVFEASVSGCVIPRSGDGSRYPLLLWLDRITDTGNLGAIMRTAHFMGVDAIVIPEHGTAPFSPVTVKASAGAAEVVPVLLVRNELDFVRKSQENGWRFIAAVAPDSASTWKSLSQQGSFTAESALDTSPCILMVGNEGDGLRPAMQKAADNFVSIRGVRGPADGVESLNVSVAAALLVARLLSSPGKRSKGDVMPPEPKATKVNDEDSSLF